VEVFASIPEIADSADWVVEGRVIGTRSGRVMYENGVPYAWTALIGIDIATAYKGADVDVLDLEVVYPVRRQFEALIAAPLPPESAILFVRNKGGDEAQYTRLVNMTQALYRVVDDRIVVADSGSFALDWAGRPRSALIDSIREALAR
jgi:hypothetical protein